MNLWNGMVINGFRLDKVIVMKKNSLYILFLSFFICLFFSCSAKITSKTADELYTIAKEYFDNDDFENAIIEYTKVIDLDSEFLFAYVGRSYSYYSIGEYEKAASDFKKIIQLEPNDIYFYYCLRVSYLGMGDYNKAVWLPLE